MATLLLVISIGIIVMGGLLLTASYDYDGLGFSLVCIGALAGILFSITIIVNLDIVASGKVIGEKISMYQTENSKIESQVDVLVKQYMEHENDTFDKAKGTDSMTLISLYPELKSDTLVKEQIKIYNKNNSQIKKLREKKIDVSVAKWWLYFGK